MRFDYTNKLKKNAININLFRVYVNSVTVNFYVNGQRLIPGLKHAPAAHTSVRDSAEGL